MLTPRELLSRVDYEPFLSSDGSRITFVSNRNGAFNVYAMKNDGSNVRRITTHAGPRHPHMVNSSLRRDARLPELLAARARGASDGRLALDLAGGLIAAGAALAWRPSGWLVLLSAALCFAAFGAWGIADREAREWPDAHSHSPPSPPSPLSPLSLLRGVRALAALVGAAAVVTLLFATLAFALGTWIS